MKKTSITILALLAAGCASIDDDYVGRTTASNMDAQIVDKTAAEGAPEGDAQIAAAATARYKAGEVKPLETEGASAGQGSGEGGQ